MTFLINLAGPWLKNITSCRSPPAPSLLIGPDKPFDRTIIGLLHVIGEEAGRQLTHPPMISYTFAANTLSVARLIAAVTFCFVLLNGALSHVRSPSIAVWLNAFPSPNSLCLRGLFAPPPRASLSVPSTPGMLAYGRYSRPQAKMIARHEDRET